MQIHNKNGAALKPNPVISSGGKPLSLYHGVINRASRISQEPPYRNSYPYAENTYFRYG